MKLRTREPMNFRLKGAIAVFAIVFALLVLSGGPDGSPTGVQATPSPVPLAPAGPSWDF